MHSLAGDHETAQALTNEHMELLKQVDSSQVLWITGKTIDRYIWRKNETTQT